MIQHDYLVNLVKINRHANVVPKRLVPGWKLVGQGAQGGSRQDDMVIFVCQPPVARKLAMPLREVGWYASTLHVRHTFPMRAPSPCHPICARIRLNACYAGS